MSVVIFTGPTLSADEGRERLDAVYLGPVSQGDVYRAALRKPWGIAIIDGYFARVPAVWHKEILWAMSQGVWVFGAASMGALRAAELHTLGMVGVGAIFEAFRDGRLEDDDEVTVIHGPEETGYLLLSEAMVNVRATLARAVEQGVLSQLFQDRIASAAKALYYPQRSYPRVLEAARAQGVDSAQLARLEAWLPDNRVDQKKADALALLSVIRERREQTPGPQKVDFHLEHTDAWDQVVRRSRPKLAAALPAELPNELLLDELRLAGGQAWRAALHGALGRALALEHARSHHVVVDEALFGETINEFFRARGLPEPAQIQAWMAQHDLDAVSLTRFMQRQAEVHWTSVMRGAEAQEQLLDHLRTTADYDRIVGRARDKQRLLQSHRAEGWQLEHASLPPDELLSWFFGDQRGEPPPADLDGCAALLGFADRHALLAALGREHYYVTHQRRA